MGTRIQRFNFNAYLEMYPEDMGNIRKTIAGVGNLKNMSHWESVAQLFLWGVESAVEKLEDEGLKQEVGRFLVNRRLADALDQERGYNKRIFNSVRELGIEKTLEVAEREGLDLEAVRRIVERATPREGEMPPTIRMEAWLETVLSDYQERHVTEIKRMAVEEGVLPGMEDEEWKGAWQLMRTVASNKGYSGSGKQGMWQMRGRRMNA